MSLATRIRLLAVLALTLCVFAMPIFTSPTEANVASACVCKFGGFDYSDGACLNGQTSCATTLRPVAFVSGYRRAATRFSGKFTSEDTLAADSRNRGRDFAD
jgi:hypothetical protein